MLYRTCSVFLIMFLMFNGVKAQEITTEKKFTILIPCLKKISSTGIFVSDVELTKLIFEDLAGLDHFELKFVPEESSAENDVNVDIKITGSYKIEANLISLDYKLNLQKTKMKLMHRIDNSELPEIKKAVLKEMSNIVTDFYIKTDPSGAGLTIDKEYMGETPILIKNELIGTHTFELKKESCYGIIQDKEITGYDTLQFSLQPEIVESFMVDEPPQPNGGMTEIQRRAKYPKIAKKLGVEGDVIIKVTIDADGSVAGIEVLRSIGDYGTTEAAIEAIKKVKWKPGIKDNKPVKSNTTVVVRYKMSR